MDLFVRGLLFALHLLQGVSQVVQSTDALTMSGLYDLDLFEGNLDGGFAGVFVMTVAITVGGGPVCGCGAVGSGG